MSSELSNDIMAELADVAEQRFAKLEQEAALSLIQGAFVALPWELQDDYRDVQDLHRQGKFEAANLAWEMWMEKAREMGLI